MLKPLLLISMTILSTLAGSIAVSQTKSTESKYKVVIARLWDIEREIEKWSKDGWEVRSMATSTQCSSTDANGLKVTSECHILVFDRKR